MGYIQGDYLIMATRKVAVVNRTNFKNYGSVLQCFALCKAIEQLGYESEIIWQGGSIAKNYDFRLGKLFASIITLITHPSLISQARKSLHSVRKENITAITEQLFERFVEENINRKTATKRELKDLALTYYDKCVCGSDQIWNPNTLYVDPLLFLRFAPKEKRVAYAPSLGSDSIPSYNKNKMKKFISDIPCVSIREKQGQKLLYELCGIEYPIVADPTLLFDMPFWTKYSIEMPFDDYVLCYFLEEPELSVQSNIVKYITELKKRVIIINSPLEFVSNHSLSERVDCGPSEFLGLVRNASQIITDSYHGMLFSIIFEKDFVSIERNYSEHNQSSRQLSILEILGLQERYSVGGTIDDTLSSIDYSVVSKKIEHFRFESLEYLKRSFGEIDNGMH